MRETKNQEKVVFKMVRDLSIIFLQKNERESANGGS